MAVLIVTESCFGNTRRVGEAIRAGIVDGGGQAQLVDAADALTELPADVDLLVVGAPTHNSGMPSPASRAQAVGKGAAASPTRGVREWIDGVAARPGVRVITFDTSQRSLFSFLGVARKAAAKALSRRGFADARAGESFWVEGVSGPLADGEEDRARQWGRSL